MGSFAMTCAVSGLAIHGGEPVRYGLVTGHAPYEDHQVCYMHDLWVPRVWPLKATYDGYGRPENMKGGPTRDAWLRGFKIDLVERGWGENTCHDTDARKDWAFEHMQEAVWKNRVRVRSDVHIWPRHLLEPREGKEQRSEDDFKNLFPKQKVPKGVPTRLRVEKILADAGLEIFTGDHKPNAVVVRHAGYGRVTVRKGDYGDQLATLKKAQVAIGGTYATMLTEGPINQGPEILVRPLPGTKDYHFSNRGKRSYEPLPVAQYFLREDVWRALASQIHEETHWRGEKAVKVPVSVENYREGAQKAWDALLKPNKRSIPVLGPEYELQHERYSGIFVKDVIPNSLGLATSFALVVKAYKDKAMTRAQVNTFLKEAAEFAFLHYVLAPTRYYWRPSYACGPQSGEWRDHERFLSVIQDIARKRAEEQEAEYID